MSFIISKENPGGFKTDAAGERHFYRGTRPPKDRADVTPLRTMPIGTLGPASPAPVAPPPPPPAAAPSALEKALTIANKVEAAQIAKEIVDSAERRDREQEELAHVNALAFGDRGADRLTVDQLLAVDGDITARRAEQQAERERQVTTRSAAPAEIDDLDYVRELARGGV